MNTGNSNRDVVALRDGSCGVGGIHCPSCSRIASAPHAGVRTSFRRLVRTRSKNFFNRDFARNPF